MTEKTKRIVRRRKLREIIIVKRDARFKMVCENCRSEQIFKLVEDFIKKESNDGEKK